MDTIDLITATVAELMHAGWGDCRPEQPAFADDNTQVIQAFIDDAIDLRKRLDAAGYVIAPKEPTEQMIGDGLIPTAAWQNIKGSALTVNREKMRLRYRAMIASLERPQEITLPST